MFDFDFNKYYYNHYFINSFIKNIQKVKTKPEFGGHPYMIFSGDLFESDDKFTTAQSVFLGMMIIN